MKAVLPALARPLIEERLPEGLDVAWFTTPDEAKAMIVDADIAWVDHQRSRIAGEIAAEEERLKWLFSIFAGIIGVLFIVMRMM